MYGRAERAYRVSCPPAPVSLGPCTTPCRRPTRRAGAGPWAASPRQRPPQPDLLTPRLQTARGQRLAQFQGQRLAHFQGQLLMRFLGLLLQRLAAPPPSSGRWPAQLSSALQLYRAACWLASSGPALACWQRGACLLQDGLLKGELWAASQQGNYPCRLLARSQLGRSLLYPWAQWAEVCLQTASGLRVCCSGLPLARDTGKCT